MAATVRSFVVYRDDDESTSAQAGSSTAVDKNAPLPPSIVLPSAATSLIVFAPDKENINPATGLRANAEQSAKKRKTGVLAVKSQIPPKKKQKESTESKGLKNLKEKDSKKRTAASSSSATKARSSGEKKTKRPLTSRKNAVPSRARRSPSLPRVAEEAEPEHAAQSVVDARCYELTVLPLADLSQAYEQVPALEDKLTLEVPGLKEDKGVPKVSYHNYVQNRLLMVLQQEHAAEISPIDRVCTPEPSAVEQTSLAEVRVPTPEPHTTVVEFSTPERKRIYSAFTFSSPSPSSERFAAARGSSVERFSDIDF